jgi:hypothetical protein
MVPRHRVGFYLDNNLIRLKFMDMKAIVTMMKSLGKRRLFYLYSICSLIYLSQVYPFTHAHHAHYTHEDSIDFPARTLINAPDNVRDGHEDNHKHHSIDRHLNDYSVANYRIDRNHHSNGSAFHISISEFDLDVKCYVGVTQACRIILLGLLERAAFNLRSPPFIP